MNLEDLGNLGEFIGAVGVIVTLIYLALQVRQNTKQIEQNTLASRAAAVNASAVALWENRKSVYENSEITKIYLKGQKNPEILSEEELYRFRLVLTNAVDTMWNMYIQTIQTGFSPETWKANGVSLVHRVIGTEGGKWYWKQYSKDYPEDFAKEVDKILGALSDQDDT